MVEEASKALVDGNKAITLRFPQASSRVHRFPINSQRQNRWLCEINNSRQVKLQRIFCRIPKRERLSSRNISIHCHGGHANDRKGVLRRSWNSSRRTSSNIIPVYNAHSLIPLWKSNSGYIYLE